MSISKDSIASESEMTYVRYLVYVCSIEHIFFLYMVLKCPQKPQGFLGTEQRGVGVEWWVDGGGGGGGMNSSTARSDPKTEETVSRRQNNSVKEVGTPPVPSNLCTSLIAASTAVRRKSLEDKCPKQQ